MRTARPGNISSLRVAAFASLMLAVASAGAAGDPGLRVQEMYVRSIAKAPPAGKRQRFDFLVFYGNGVAYRGDASSFTNERLRKVNGLRLQGTYVIAAGSAEPVWITFGSDTTFWDQGVIRHAANLQVLERGVPAPQGGGGTYSFDEYTLTLSYAGGPAAKMFFCILPGEKDLARPKQLVISTYLFELKQ